MGLIAAVPLVAGSAEGTALVLETPLSFWGGIDPESGRIIDVRHPQRGARVAGTVLVMPLGRGSSSSSTILAEATRLGTAPSAVVLAETDAVLVVGAIVAQRLYGRAPVIVRAASIDAIETGDRLRIREDGTIECARPGC